LPITGQFLRYALTGIGSNIILYLLYLASTALGAEPKVTMSVLYLIGVLQTFMVNRSWSFRHRGAAGTALRRYLIAYAMGYLVNLGFLALLVDDLRWDHRYVQGAAIVVIAFMLFGLQRIWVFGPATKPRA
jgi:putative flippase GtrA